MIFMIIFCDVYDMAVINSVYLKRNCTAWPVSENGVLDLEVGEASGCAQKGSSER